MLTLKQFKVQILDDQIEQMRMVKTCAIQRAKSVDENETLQCIDRYIQVIHAQVASQAIVDYCRTKPDLIFTDLVIDEFLEPEEAVFNRHKKYQGLYFLDWLYENARAQNTRVKVHSKHGNLDEVLQELGERGVAIRDHFAIQEGNTPGERLRQSFPESLRQIAVEYCKSLRKSKEIRDTILAFTDKKKCDVPLDCLQGFSVFTLLVGWLKIDTDPKTLKPFIEFSKDIHTILDELLPPLQELSKKNHAMTRWLKHPDFALQFEEAKIQAKEVVVEFLHKWGPVKLEDASNALKMNLKCLQDAKKKFDQYHTMPFEDPASTEVCLKVFRLRLIIGGIYALKSRLNPCVQERILDCAVVACIRNAPDDLKQIGACESQRKKYFSCLDLSKDNNIHEKAQALDENSFSPEEMSWFESLEGLIL